MGKRNKQTKVKRKGKVFTAPKERSATTGAKYSVEQLLEKTEECLDSFNYELAEKFCKRALELCPNHVKTLETSGSVQLELGNLELAKQFFSQAVEIEPDTGHSKYMYMGQLLTGSESIQSFMKGIDLLKTQLELQQSAEVEAGTSKDKVSSRDLSCAYCSVAEIYLTDACFEENAESECKECLELAISADSSNPEAHHLQASYYLSTHNNKKAFDSIERGLSLWLPQLQDAEKPDGATSVDPINVCAVSYPTRVNVAKMLLEMEKYEVATEVLELLLDEEDTVVEVWYLLGWAHFLQGDDYKDTARYYLNKADKLAVKTHCEDEQLVAHIAELLQEIGLVAEDEANGDDMDFDIVTDSDDDDDDNTDKQTDKNTENMEL